MKQEGRARTDRAPSSRGVKALTEHIWETFDNLFKTVHRQTRRVEELEARVIELERRLNERSPLTQPKSLTATEMPVERAA